MAEGNITTKIGRLRVLNGKMRKDDPTPSFNTDAALASSAGILALARHPDSTAAQPGRHPGAAWRCTSDQTQHTRLASRPAGRSYFDSAAAPWDDHRSLWAAAGNRRRSAELVCGARVNRRRAATDGRGATGWSHWSSNRHDSAGAERYQRALASGGTWPGARSRSASRGA